MVGKRSVIFYYSILMALCFCGCSQCTYEEIDRVTSPDSKVDAVHIRGNCGATTSFTDHVFLVPKGEKTPDPADDFQCLLADHTSGLKLIWTDAKVLDIIYREARIYRFTNFWHTEKLDNYSHIVEIRLNPSRDRSLSIRDR